MMGAPSQPTTYTATASATPTSPTRSSRLRGLSYLRSYTHNHSSRGDRPPISRATSSPTSPTTPSTRRQNTQNNTAEERGNPALPSSRLESSENGWIPTIEGRSGLTRESLHPTTTSTASSATAMMTRSRGPGPTPASSSSQRRPSAFESSSSTGESAAPLSAAATAFMPSTGASGPSSPTPGKSPTIRFMPHVEPRSTRPSLHFTAVSRTLDTANSVVRVGRYSERDSHHAEPNVHPVGFKSKVVSRRHCEFWCTNGQWYIKDVRSSSGTFLNHVRLSSPGAESRPFPVNDGDVVQLGIDFKGGEEVIFRCVKIRVEVNRGWQKSLNSFNTSAHKRLLTSAKSANRDSDAASVNNSECSICLNPVAPCQALFVAPCSHVWHYKCVRSLIHSANWPNFLCPNCRFMADLEADVEEDVEYEQYEAEQMAEQTTPPVTGHGDQAEMSDDNSLGMGESENDDDDNDDDDEGQPQRAGSTPRLGSVSRANEMDEDLEALLQRTVLDSPSSLADSSSSSSHRTAQAWGSSQPITIGRPGLGSRDFSDPIGARSMTPTSHTQFALSAGPISESHQLTPRNEAGPFILDGAAEASGRPDNTIVEPARDEPASPTILSHARTLR